MAVVQTEGKQFLKAGIDLLVQGGVLRCDLPEFLEESRPTLVIVPLGGLQALAVLCVRLGSLGETGLGMHGAGAFHRRCRGGARHSPLAAGGFFLLGWGCCPGGRGLGRAVSLRGRVVVYPPHVVVQVPSTWESVSGNGPFTSLPEA